MVSIFSFFFSKITVFLCYFHFYCHPILHKISIFFLLKITVFVLLSGTGCHVLGVFMSFARETPFFGQKLYNFMRFTHKSHENAKYAYTTLAFMCFWNFIEIFWCTKKVFRVRWIRRILCRWNQKEIRFRIACSQYKHHCPNCAWPRTYRYIIIFIKFSIFGRKMKNKE